MTDSTPLQACQRYVDVRYQRAVQLMQYWQQESEINTERGESKPPQYALADAFVLLMWQAVVGWVYELNAHYHCQCEAIQLLHPEHVSDEASLPMDFQHLFELARQSDSWLAQLLSAVKQLSISTSSITSPSLFSWTSPGIAGEAGNTHKKNKFNNQIPVTHIDTQTETASLLQSSDIDVTDLVTQFGKAWLTSFLEEINRARMLLVEY
ncbi:hypothetical protein [Zooshikella harenae]|uniref:Uncharacterized protein n=1 Tax=Zooshikella harenae TaxID=2827238 RepID=A0ABS5ZAZ0_9GAMM|nr:hypothetical protein [Zooshikella harenae]MBU2711231.1 hypothetical protein [Zooshikella harenae]